MTLNLRSSVFILFAALHIAGCSQSPATNVAKREVDSRYILSDEPKLTLSVVEFKEHTQDGEAISVVGRVGGGVKPWIEGRSAFLLVDEGAPLPCEGDSCGPECQHCAREIAQCTTVVKIVDAQGKTLPIDSRDLLGLKEEETVIVRGSAKRDEAGNVALMATGVFIKR